MDDSKSYELKEIILFYLLIKVDFDLFLKLLIKFLDVDVFVFVLIFLKHLILKLVFETLENGFG